MRNFTELGSRAIGGNDETAVNALNAAPSRDAHFRFRSVGEIIKRASSVPVITIVPHTRVFHYSYGLNVNYVTLYYWLTSVFENISIPTRIRGGGFHDLGEKTVIVNVTFVSVLYFASSSYAIRQHRPCSPTTSIPTVLHGFFTIFGSLMFATCSRELLDDLGKTNRPNPNTDDSLPEPWSRSP